MDIQGDNLLLEILKWVGIVFAAGFVGYFGRYLAMLIIDRVRKKRAQQITAEPTQETSTSQDTRLEESRLKLEKKKAKAKVKRAKKEEGRN
jgi:hypothetical protein